MKEKAKLIEEMFEKGVLVSEDFLVKGEHQEESNTIAVEDDLLVLNSDYADVIKQQTSLVDWYELDKQRVEVEKDRNDELYQNELQSLKKTSLVFNSPQKTKKAKKYLIWKLN